MTTDTALMVTHEILEQKVLYGDLSFTTEPDVPTGPEVVSFVEEVLKLEEVCSGEKFSSEKLKPENLKEEVEAFKK